MKTSHIYLESVMLKYIYQAQGHRFGYYVENRLKGPLPDFLIAPHKTLMRGQHLF